MKQTLILTLALLWVLVTPLSSTAQSETGGASTMDAQEIALVKSDLKSRFGRSLPMEESDLVDERNWIRETKSRIDRTRYAIENRRGSGMGPQKDLEKMEGELLGIMEKVKAVQCDNQEIAKSRLQESYSSFTDLRSGYSHIIDSYDKSDGDGPADWAKVEDRFDQLGAYYGGGAKPSKPFTQGSCAEMVKLFNQPSFRSDIDTYFTEKGQEYSMRAQLMVDEEKAITELSQDLAQYDNLIDEALKDANTKRTALDNLFIIVAILVVLSVGSIAIIRIFPYELMREWIESGQVIQFVTVTIILIVIVVLGLTGLLTENSLGTLLGGIGGYVLSQGVGRAAAKNALRSKAKKEAEKEGSEMNELVKALEKESEKPLKD